MHHQRRGRGGSGLEPFALLQMVSSLVQQQTAVLAKSPATARGQLRQQP